MIVEKLISKSLQKPGLNIKDVNNLHTPLATLSQNITMSLSDRLYNRTLGINKVHDIIDDLIPKYNVNKELNEHSGCVNTVQFNETGDLLISGSDDKYICIWDGYSFELKDKIFTDHGHNIFSVAMMNGDGIVSCCALGDVKFTNLNGQSEQIHNHHNEMAYQIQIIDRHSFMSCGEDGFVVGYDIRDWHYGKQIMLDATQIYQKEHELLGNSKHRVTERGIPSLSLKDDVYFAAAFNDDFVRIFDRRQLNQQALYAWCPPSFNPLSPPTDLKIKRHRIGSRITSCQYDNNNNGNLAISYSDESVYVIHPEDWRDRHDVEKFSFEAPIATLSGHLNKRTMIKECSFLGNNSQYVMSGSDDGRVYIWDIDTQEVVNSFEADQDVVNCCVSHPVIPCLVMSGIDHTIKVCYPENEAFNKEEFDAYLSGRLMHNDFDEYTLRMPLSQLLEILQQGGYQEDEEEEEEDALDSEDGTDA